MDEFRIAGTTGGESEERLLSQVVQIAGYTSSLRMMVRDEFRFCDVHGVSVLKARSRHAHTRCVEPLKRSPASDPRGGLR